VLGAALLTLVFKFIPSQEVQGMFYGGALIAVLVAAPNGVIGLLARIRPPFPRSNPASRGRKDTELAQRRA
jgi:ABC-type branched-subunit amino acid transport system permease subunit